MASIINASSSGSGGIVQTADASGVLQLQTNGTVGLTISNIQDVSVPSAFSVAMGATENGIITNGRSDNTSAYRNHLLFYRGNKTGSGIGFGTYGGGSNDATSVVWQNTSAGEGGSLNTNGIGLGATNAPTSGIGIKFPATQSASSDANTLDDYEEGTFTPSITFGGNAVGITYGTRVGRYTKIGNCVTFNLYCPMTNKGSSTGIFNIIGLPFTSQNVSAGYNTFTLWTNNTNSTLSGVVQGYVTNGSTAVTFEFQASGFYGAMGGLTNTQCNNNSDFMVGGMYFV
jgi:hypothetical protein